MSRSKGRSSLHEPRYNAQLIYLMICVGLPYVPHGGLRPCDGTHLSHTMMSVFWDDGVFHTVADSLSQIHW